MNPGPGHYGQHSEFGSDSKAMTIGQKRDLVYDQHELGPGEYEHERADKLTKHSS